MIVKEEARKINFIAVLYLQGAIQGISMIFMFVQPEVGLNLALVKDINSFQMPFAKKCRIFTGLRSESGIAPSSFLQTKIVIASNCLLD